MKKSSEVLTPDTQCEKRLLFNHLVSFQRDLRLLVRFSPGNLMAPEKVHEKLFVGSQKEFKKPSHPAVARYNRERSAEQLEKMKDKLLRKESKLRKRLAAHGVDYDFPGFVSVCGLETLVSSRSHGGLFNFVSAEN